MIPATAHPDTTVRRIATPSTAAHDSARDAAERIRILLDALPASKEASRTGDRAAALAAVVAELKAGDDIVRGAALYPLLGAGLVDETMAARVFDDAAIRIARESVKLGEFGTPAQWEPGAGLPPAQAEALRKMLLAVVTDARLILIRLADQLYRLRSAQSLGETERMRVALETREVYAPLANRLGIWQLKWELEDLSFRYLEPENYRRVAGWLAAKRTDRERHIAETVEEIRRLLEQAGIAKPEVAGRPKHLYSIWRKMQRKQLAFDELYDVRAVRVLVDTVADCYAALGLVHGRWPYIPGEFDDYIATPKDNLYRSLHTAVIGPGKLPLEIQIRTREMHDHAELGVAAHWRYKEGGPANPAYEQKIVWLRQILEPAAAGDFLESVRHEIFEDRVYALSPRGEVVELPRGATPLDFAYHVHTELGHRCRGARVNGRMVPLTQPLHNGDQVEIITAKAANPSRDWLVPTLGYLASPRNRAKVRAWFRRQDAAQNLVQGRQILERELQRLAIESVTLPDLIGEFGFVTAEQLYLAVGEGDITGAQISGAVQRRARAHELPAVRTRRPGAASAVKSGADSAIRVDGIGDLLSTFARCCRPVPPEPIAGYITLGRGVSIHRQNCRNLVRLGTVHPERVVAVDWGRDGNPGEGPDTPTFAADLAIQAYDRRGLLRDITAVLADNRVDVQSMSTRTQEADGIADMTVRVGVRGLPELSRVLARIQALPNVISARRRAG